MANLLDQASIVLTPTAYDNGKVLCAKPSEAPYGDFDFSRNSAATRVNAQGLVENVQILSSNLVQNGDFSEEGVQEVSNGSFSQEGSEVVVNGDFALNSNWSGTNTIVNGQLTKGSGGGLVYQATLDGTIKSYKVTINVAEKNGASLNLYLGGNQFSLNEGVQTLYVQSGNSNTFIGFNNGADSIINSISCVEVGQNWNLGSGWSIGEDKLNFTNVNGSSNQSGVFVIGKTYKITVDYTFTSGTRFILPYDGSNYNSDMRINTPSSAIGYTYYYTPLVGDTLFTYSDGNGNGSITNISVKEVGMDWNFDANWSIGNNKAISTGVGRMFQSIPFLETNVGTKVKVSFDIVDYTSAGVVINCYGGVSSLFQGVGSYSFITTTTNTLNLYVNNGGQGNLVGSITNLSVIAITEDTNLPRINYEGFSYQDALGSEEVLNGTFDNGGSSWSLGSWTAQNNTATINGQSGILSQASPPLVSGKKYKWTFEITEYNSGSVKLYSGGGADAATYENSVGIHTQYFVANGTGKYFYSNSFNGSITNVSVKEYLGQEVVPNSGCGSWLWEPQTTQIVPYSEDFSQWNTLDATSAITYISDLVNPDGSIGGYKISGSGIYLAFGFLSATSERNIYARTVSGTGDAQLLSHNSNTNNVFNITEDWQRFDVNSSPGSASTNFYIDLRGAASTLTELYVWGANATNDQDYVTSYIPATDGSSVTRNQDVCTNGGSLASINSTSGVLYWEGKRFNNDFTNTAISLNNGSFSNSVAIKFRSNENLIFALVYSNSNLEALMQYTVSDITDFTKIAISYAENNFALWVNGLKVLPDTSGNIPIGLTNLSFNTGGTVENFFGKTKALAVWKEALTDSELQSLTTI